MLLKTPDKEYLNLWFSKKIIRYTIKRIESKFHRIETYDVCKIYVLFL